MKVLPINRHWKRVSNTQKISCFREKTHRHIQRKKDVQKVVHLFFHSLKPDRRDDVFFIFAKWFDFRLKQKSTQIF